MSWLCIWHYPFLSNDFMQAFMLLILYPTSGMGFISLRFSSAECLLANWSSTRRNSRWWSVWNLCDRSYQTKMPRAWPCRRRTLGSCCPSKKANICNRKWWPHSKVGKNLGQIVIVNYLIQSLALEKAHSCIHLRPCMLNELVLNIDLVLSY